MNEKELIVKFSKINQKLYDQAAEPLKCHDLQHHLRVYQYVKMLAKDLKLKYDPEVLIPACLFHDVSAYYPNTSREEHHVVSCRYAETELNRIKYPKDKTEKILKAISRHGTDHKPKNGIEAIETTLLRDADKIETAGPLGIARIIMAETRRGKSLKEIANKWSERMDKKTQAITFNEAKKSFAKDFRYSKDFFIKLKKQVKDGLL